MQDYCPSLYRYHRRPSRVVQIGNVAVGGANPIRVQSMLTCDTMDTTASIQQTLDLAAVGCEIVRITAPTVKDAANLEHIVAGLRERGCTVPIVADIHFKPDAAMEAAKWVEKVRINPGNYADSKKFNVREYTDTEYAAELDRIRERFTPLVRFCKEHGRAIRIGTNHGSLSDRIMNRYGDTPLGMVESALEFARIARDLGFHEFVFSMKSSNPKVMIEAYRLLTARLLSEEGKHAAVESGSLATDSWQYPLHLGVTEAGDGEDGRIKSAIGIGSLLSDGIGDTIRVSLTEDSVHEIPVAEALARRTQPLAEWSERTEFSASTSPTWDPFVYNRRDSSRLELSAVQPPESRIGVGGEELIRVAIRPEKATLLAHKFDRLGDFTPDFILTPETVVALDPRDEKAIAAVHAADDPHLVTVRDGIDLPVITAFRLLAARLESRHPILLKDTLVPAPSGSDDSTENSAFLDHLLTAATNLGALLCDGIGDAILVQGEGAPGQSLRLAFNTLQAAGSRIFKTDYVACPSCGRTLFNLQETTARIKAATVHLKGVKIAIMGCIVNGPGEMADADFGYVGGAPGKINLYVGKKPVKFNIPQDEAVERLKDLIKEHGKWVEPIVEAVEPDGSQRFTAALASATPTPSMLPAVLTTLLWSCSAICAARSARMVGGAAANVTRMAVATLLLGLWAHFSPWAYGLGGPALPWFLVSGFVGFGLGDVAMFIALQRIGPRLTMLLTHCLAAPLAATTEWLWLGEGLGWKEIIYAGIILAGVALALAPDHGSGVGRRDFWLGVLGGLGSAAGQGLGSVLSRKANEVATHAGYSVDGGTAAYERIVVGLLVAFVFFLIIRRAKPEPPAAPGVWSKAWVWITCNALAGPTIGVACYQWGLKTTQTGIIMPIVALAPIVTQLLAWAVDGTPPTRRTLLGGIIAIAGVIGLRLAQTA